jgi:two-component system response regulator NreC
VRACWASGVFPDVAVGAPHEHCRGLRVRAFPRYGTGVYPVIAVPANPYSGLMSGHLQLAPHPSVERTPLATAEPIRVVVADDHDFMRRRLRLLLENEHNIEVVAEADDLGGAVGQVHGCRPHVLVLDLSMPGGSSLQTISELRERVPDTQIVVVTMEENPAFAQRALVAGALGFVSKEHADTDLPEAVRAAAHDEEYLSASVAARLAAVHRSLTNEDLTVREVEVLRLITLGYTTVEIARKLHVSPRTVESHRAHTYTKLGARTRAELVRYALRSGLLRS